MENRYQHTVNGQEVEQDDLNVLGESSGLADDRVFADLFRMKPYNGSTVQKGVLTSGYEGSGELPLVAPNGASGSVLVNAFRAFVGSRTAVATDAKKNWRDVRSAIAVGTTTLAQTVSFGAGDPTNPRWDLVYAAITPDANGTSVTRKVKDPTSKAITGQSIVTTLTTTVTVAVQAGVAAASPDWPAIASDAGGVYYIPLAYVRIPSGFSGTSTIDERDIAIVAPVLHLARTTGAACVRAASAMNKQAGSLLTTANTEAWGSSGTAPRLYIPPSMTGGDTLVLPIGFASGEFADGSILDDSRDWRGRLTRFWVQTKTGATATFPWAGTGTDDVSVSTTVPGIGYGNTCVIGAGDTVLRAAYCTVSSGAVIYVYADATTGFLKLKVFSGAPGANDIALFWIDFSGPIDNYRR